MRLTERERRLLSEAADFAIADSCGEYYRVGGHGSINITYNRASYPNLERRGLVMRENGCVYIATTAGRAALKDGE